jgi:hypothetical protein
VGVPGENNSCDTHFGKPATDYNSSNIADNHKKPVCGVGDAKSLKHLVETKENLVQGAKACDYKAAVRVCCIIMTGRPVEKVRPPSTMHS